MRARVVVVLLAWSCAGARPQFYPSGQKEEVDMGAVAGEECAAVGAVRAARHCPRSRARVALGPRPPRCGFRGFDELVCCRAPRRPPAPPPRRPRRARPRLAQRTRSSGGNVESMVSSTRVGLRPVALRLGATRLDGQGEGDGAGERRDSDYGVAAVALHPEHDRRFRYHDLALLRTARPVALSPRVRPACLPAAPGVRPEEGAQALSPAVT
ncbi:Lumbrokinase-3(1) precursor, putative [Gryllus bimaculatus]|nr:Lumbrokinase-3(1) precursor, putative [Gryllus bimaculatus]